MKNIIISFSLILIFASAFSQQNDTNYINNTPLIFEGKVIESIYFNFNDKPFTAGYFGLNPATDSGVLLPVISEHGCQYFRF